MKVPFTDLYHYSQLFRRGVFSERGVAEGMRRQEFGVVVLTFDLQRAQDRVCMNHYLGEGVRRAILEHYEFARSMEMPGPERTHIEDHFYAWVPHPYAQGSGVGSTP